MITFSCQMDDISRSMIKDKAKKRRKNKEFEGFDDFDSVVKQVYSH